MEHKRLQSGAPQTSPFTSFKHYLVDIHRILQALLSLEVSSSSQMSSSTSSLTSLYLTTY